MFVNSSDVFVIVLCENESFNVSRAIKEEVIMGVMGTVITIFNNFWEKEWKSNGRAIKEEELI